MPNCQNCKTSLSDNHRFCHACGQEASDHSRNMGVLIKHFLADYFTFDNKLFRSLIPLIFKPGFLTKEYLSGRRVSYIPPLRLYLFISLVFFLLLSLQGNSEDEWDRFFGTHLPRLFFFMLPMFALFLRMLYFKKHGNMVPHFLFALHYHAFLFLTAFVLIGLNAIFAAFDAFMINRVVTALFALGWLTYLILAMRKVYSDKSFLLILRFLALLVLYFLVLSIGALCVFLMVADGVETL